MAFKVKKHVTLPLFKLDQTERFLRFETPYYIGKVVDDKKEPPHMARVTDMETGELGELILGTVLVTKLNEEYPENNYVGKIFCLSKTSPEGSRKYALYHITEVEETPDQPGAATSQENQAATSVAQGNLEAAKQSALNAEAPADKPAVATAAKKKAA